MTNIKYNNIQCVRKKEQKYFLHNFNKFARIANMVARDRWAFQVSQVSVETLFRWGGKRLHDFA